MEIPIINSLYKNNEKFSFNNKDFNYLKFNGLNFLKPDTKTFPLLKILKYDFNGTFFEIILVCINDVLVNLYLKNSINYISIHKLLLKLLKKPYFTSYYDKSPKNIKEIENMVKKVKKYLHNYFELNDKFYKNNN